MIFALVAGQLVPEIIALHDELFRLKAEEGGFKAVPFLLDHAPGEAGREHALGHLGEHAIVGELCQRLLVRLLRQQLLQRGRAALALLRTAANRLERGHQNLRVF
jgi:hypothetical protein